MINQCAMWHERSKSIYYYGLCASFSRRLRLGSLSLDPLKLECEFSHGHALMVGVSRGPALPQPLPLGLACRGPWLAGSWANQSRVRVATHRAGVPPRPLSVVMRGSSFIHRFTLSALRLRLRAPAREASAFRFRFRPAWPRIICTSTMI